MNVDHIFIFTNNESKAADELVAFGFTEGSRRTHEGQGTANRIFVFENFYLKILWVYYEPEIKSEQVLPTGLWTRANAITNGVSPFGLCINNTEDSDKLFADAFAYQPNYFPDGMTIKILNNQDNLSLPWTFRLPFKRDKQKPFDPHHHKNGIRTLTKAEFSFASIDDKRFLLYFEDETAIQFTQSHSNWLILTFDNGSQGLTRKFTYLKLTITY